MIAPAEITAPASEKPGLPFRYLASSSDGSYLLTDRVSARRGVKRLEMEVVGWNEKSEQLGPLDLGFFVNANASNVGKSVTLAARKLR